MDIVFTAELNCHDSQFHFCQDLAGAFHCTAGQISSQSKIFPYVWSVPWTLITAQTAP